VKAQTLLSMPAFSEGFRSADHIFWDIVLRMTQNSSWKPEEVPVFPPPRLRSGSRVTKQPLRVALHLENLIGSAVPGAFELFTESTYLERSATVGDGALNSLPEGNK
jgi:hypothetical protein